MTEERPKGFLSRVFGPPEEEDQTTVYSSGDSDALDREPDEEVEENEEEHIEETGRNFTVERAAEIIKHLPPEVPRSSAVRIVRQTLTAAGINIETLSDSTSSRETKLSSEIDRRQERIRDLRERTEEEVRELERKIRDSRQSRDSGVASEERKISSARDGLEDVERVRDFFSLPRGEAQGAPGAGSSAVPAAEPEEPTISSSPDSPPVPPKPAPDSASDETQVIDRSEYAPEPEEEAGEDDTRVIRRGGPLSDEWDTRGNRENPNRENRDR